MQKIYLISLWLLSNLAVAQIVKIIPANASSNNEVELIYDAALGTGGLKGESSVYMHAGVVTSGVNGTAWSNVIGNWGKDDGIGKMTKLAGETDKWSIKLSPSIRKYFGVPQGIPVFRLSMVFRNADGSKEGKGTPGNFTGGTVASNQDIFLNLNVSNYIQFTEPQKSILFLTPGTTFPILAMASGTAKTLNLYLDNGKGFEKIKTLSEQKTISFDYPASASEKIKIKAEAIFATDTQSVTKDLEIILRNQVFSEKLPDGIQKGINYLADESKVVLVLEAPKKEFVYVVGDFNNWQIKEKFLMNRTPDGELFWLEIDSLQPNKPYVFQYWVDGVIKIGDPLCDQVADPWNDKYILSNVYPNLPEYQRENFGIASVLQTGQKTFPWAETEKSRTRPDKNELIIYELLVRDFIGSHHYKDLADTLTYLKRLGVNAIELMPIMEFEGNESWGYNPSYFLAPDKYYGSKNDLKNFIQVAHQQGFVVILDMVLNHAFGQNAMVQMYWDAANNRPSADNPWFNVEATHPFSVGYDFNHESLYTQAFVDTVNAYWLNEFHFDGFRFDLSKGFTQKKNTDVTLWGHKDDSRIAILKRMADKIRQSDPDAFIILEHFADSAEEDILKADGMMTWGNNTFDYGNLLTGNTSVNINSAAELNRVSYMESHDEDRLMFKAENSAAKTTTYTLSDDLIAINRVKMLAAFFYTLPGAKMMWQFQELGYDIDINFNGRVGNKPLVWGEGSLNYYKDDQRQNLYKTHAAIINLVNQNRPVFSSGILTKSLGGAVKTIKIQHVDMSVCIVGNFDIKSTSATVSFPEVGMYYDLFSGDSLSFTSGVISFNLQPGEFHIYTSKKQETKSENLVTVFKPIVSTDPAEITADGNIKLKLKANLAASTGKAIFKDLAKIFMVAGVITDSPTGTDLKYLKGQIEPKGEFTKVPDSDNVWEFTLNPRTYFGVPETEDIYRIGLYFISEDKLTTGKGYGNEIIWLNVKQNGQIVKVNPAEFQSDTPITITFDATQGTAGLVGVDKVYMHAGVITSSVNGTDWQYVVGNWGKDDGVGKMTKVTGTTNKWEITITPKTYFPGVPSSAKWYRIGMVFRNADGSKEGKADGGKDIFVNFTEKKVDESVLAVESNTTSIKVFPNPANGYIHIQSEEPIQVVELYNNLGIRVCYKKTDSMKDPVLPISQLQSGVYILKIIKESGSVSKRILLN